MLGWNEIVQNYIIKYSNPIKKATQPLRDHFGVGYFTYHRIDPQGKYTVLVDRPDWAEHYVNEKIFLIDPYLKNPEVYQSGISLVESHGSLHYKQTICKAGKQILNMDLGLILIQKTLAGVEFFGFSGNKMTCCLEKIYLNNQQLLIDFGNYFKGQLSSILMKMEKEASSLLDLKGKGFLCNKLIQPDITLPARTAFLKDLGMIKELQQASKLSLREKQCLQLLIQHKTFKKIGIDLSLSRRTVEFYFENIKNKLSCYTKQEVVEVAKRLDALGLLSLP